MYENVQCLSNFREKSYANLRKKAQKAGMSIFPKLLLLVEQAGCGACCAVRRSVLPEKLPDQLAAEPHCTAALVLSILSVDLCGCCVRDRFNIRPTCIVIESCSLSHCFLASQFRIASTSILVDVVPLQRFFSTRFWALKWRDFFLPDTFFGTRGRLELNRAGAPSGAHFPAHIFDPKASGMGDIRRSS